MWPRQGVPKQVTLQLRRQVRLPGVSLQAQGPGEVYLELRRQGHVRR
jgi:hypothetical protein